VSSENAHYAQAQLASSEPRESTALQHNPEQGGKQNPVAAAANQ